MKALFVHDHPFFEDGPAIYSGGGLPASVWNNYLLFFDEISVIGRKAKNPNKHKVLSSGDSRVKFHLLENYTSPRDFVVNLKRTKRKIADLVRNSDAVIIRMPSFFGGIAAKQAVKQKKPYVVEQVGNAKEALLSHKSIIAKLSAYSIHNMNKKVVKKAPYVQYVTEKKLQQDYPTKGTSYSISDVLLLKRIEEENLESDRFFKKIFKIGLIGGFDAKYKGQDILLKAVTLLPQAIKDNIELYFVGVGNGEWLEQLAKEMLLVQNVKFIGALPAGEEIVKFLKSLTMYVQPSLTEGMPRATLEAMSMGCPVLGSKVGGMPDILEPHVIHTPKDYKTLSNQILRFYNNRALLINESKLNLKRVEPYLKYNLDKKRKDFYTLVLSSLKV